MSTLIERQHPNWPPGTAIGYHATTIGWLIDQIVRRCDQPKHRGIGDFFRQEIALPNGKYHPSMLFI
jgi:hypothetical protein